MMKRATRPHLPKLSKAQRRMYRPMFRRVERQATRFHEMMDRLDVDPSALVRVPGGDAYAEARSRCLFCGTTDKCLRCLDQPLVWML